MKMRNVFLRSKTVGLLFSYVNTSIAPIVEYVWSMFLFFCMHYEVFNLVPIPMSIDICLVFARSITETSCMGCWRRISNLTGKCSQSYPCMNRTLSSRWLTYPEIHFQETRMWWSLQERQPFRAFGTLANI